MPKRRRRVAVIIIVLALLACAGAMTYRFARPARPRPTGPNDVAAAKAVGDELLASADTTIVAFIAHPDDAEWWIGGTLGMLAKRNRVVLVLGTSGEAGNLGLEPDLGAIREGLQREGAALLGYADVIFLRHPDGHLAEAKDYPGEVASIIASESPATIITFDVERESLGYRHPDHETAGRVAREQARRFGGIRLYLFHTAAPDVLTDYGPVAADKMKALQTLASYHDRSPLAWLSRLARAVGLERAAITYGSRNPFPEVGITYGELFRKDDSAL